MTSYRQPDADFALAVEGGDELLPAPSELDPAWLRHGRRPAVLLLAVAVAGGFAVHATSGHASRPAAEATSAVPSPHGEVRYVEASQVARPVSGLVSDDLSDGCPAGVTCRTSTVMPASVAAALRAAFGTSQAASARTVTTGDRTLVHRFVHVLTDSADVTVQILDTRLRRSSSASGSGSASIVVAQRPVGTSTVRVTVGGPAASLRPGSPTMRLLVDPRLLLLS